MGTPEIAATCLTALLEAGLDVVGAISQPDKPKGRGYTLTPPPVKVGAEARAEQLAGLCACGQGIRWGEISRQGAELSKGGRRGAGRTVDRAIRVGIGEAVCVGVGEGSVKGRSDQRGRTGRQRGPRGRRRGSAALWG